MSAPPPQRPPPGPGQGQVPGFGPGQQQARPQMMGHQQPGPGYQGQMQPQRMQPGTPAPGGQFQQGRPPAGAFGRPPPSPAPGGLAPGQPGFPRPGSTGPSPMNARPGQPGQPGQPGPPGPPGPQRMMSPPGQVPPPGAMGRPMPPQRNGSLTPGPSGAPGPQGRMSPQPPLPGQPQQHQQMMGRPMSPPGVRPGMPPQGLQPQTQAQVPVQGLDQQMAGMSLQQQGPEQPEMGPTRTKRSARAYHTDAPAPSGGYNDAPPQPAPGQAPWQAAAAARVAAYEAQHDQPADDMGHLDQMPGQRNVLSPADQAAARARLAAHQAGIGAGNAPSGGAFTQPMNMGTPGPGSAPQGDGSRIAQPPHHAGQRFAGPRSKIDPDQIPSPVEAQDADQEFFDREWFATCGRGGLPLSTTDFAAVDQGNCSPKHMRLTTYSLPHTDELALTSQLPLAVIVQPFAQQRADELQVPVVEFGEGGPPRCKKCRAYINPWCVFVEGGQKWVCNLCGGTTEVSPEYFCNLDMSGRRVDFDSRPELSRGTCDFRVPREYWAVQASPPASVLLPVAPASSHADTARLSPRPDADGPHSNGSTLGMTGAGGAAAKAATKAASDAMSAVSIGMGRTTVRAPRPMTYLFAIDVSFSAIRCGALQTSVEAIRETIYGPKQEEGEGANGESEKVEKEGEEVNGPGFGLPHGSRIAILTFDRALHFYNLSATLDQAQMLVVPDIDEPFVPISEGLLADPWESRSNIENLLQSLPSIFAENMAAEAALGAAVRGAQAALSTIGGQVNIFLSTIPTVGPGALKHREDTKLYGTEKEKNLFVAQDGFYRGAAEECVEAGIGINVFFFPSQYIDVATIGYLTGLTGGEMYFHPRFDPVRDGTKLRAEINRTVLREAGYNVTMRVRCSNGLRVAEHYGNFFQRNVTDLEMGNIDADKAFAALIKHEGRLDEKNEAHFQCAVLYTTSNGERRVRCHNIAVPVTSLLGNVFRYADMDSTIAYYAKEVIAQAQVKPLKDVRHYLTEKCVKVLLAYRKNCASSTSPGQLILPESFKLFPLYALGINKSKAIKGGNVTSDVRTFYMRQLRALGTGATMALLYPRMIALHTMADEDGFPIQLPDGGGVGGRIKTPPLMRPSYLRMEAHGAYLIENGEMCILWIGSAVNPRFLEDLYAVSRLDELDSRMTTLPALPTRLSRQVRNIVTSFAAQRCKPALPVLIARQNMDGTEVEFSNLLVEDQNNEAMSYVDYLCFAHKRIQGELTGAAAKDENEGSSMWRGPW